MPSGLIYFSCSFTYKINNGIFPGLYAQVILSLFCKQNLFLKRNNEEVNIIKETMIFNNY